MIYLRSFLFNLLYASWSFFSSVLFLPLFIPSAHMAQKVGRPWANGVLLLARLICGMRYEVRGIENMLGQPVIFASKHQSAWDTVIMLSLLPRPAYILKRSLLLIPGWGWYLWRMRMIAIDRGAGASTIKSMVKQAKAELADGRDIIIFPEGTRTRPGADSEYHPGIIALYNQLNVPVVPVALNSGYYWAKDAFIKRPGTIVIEFLPAIAPGLPKDEFMTRLKTTIETASHKLLKEAQSA